MREGTSGFWVTEDNGRISIGYEDYGVSQFGGGNFEMTYRLDEENSQRLVAELRKEYRGTLGEMIEAAFGKNFRDPDFRSFCRERAIEYSSFSWTG